MSYKKTKWIDHIKDIDSGEVIQQGTAITANRLNNIEDALETSYNAIEYTPGYGLEWNTLTDTYKRIGLAEGKSQEDFDGFAPWKNMHRCIVDDDLEVLAYHGDLNYADGGALGQAMVEIRKFWHKVEQAGVVIRYWISDKYSAGYEVHPAFVRGETEVDAIYMGTYEASIFNTSDAKYFMKDEQDADFNEDILSSISGAKPASGQTQQLTLPNSRKLANNRGENWGLMDFDSANAVQLLFLVEYASFNSQDAIGKGVTSLTSENDTDSFAVNTGQTSSLGNKSGMADGDNGQVSVSYRGIENFWGNIFTWMDGVNFRDHRPYYNITGVDFESDKFDGNYSDAGFVMPDSTGYIKAVGTTPVYPSTFLPIEVGGSSTTFLADRYTASTNLGARVAALGGSWANGAYAGAFYLDASYSSSIRSRIRGARLLAVPAKINGNED